MFQIVRKEMLNPTICLLEVEAPFVARKAKPGQFIILRIDEKGERLPLTIGGYDREKGTVTIIFQLVGLTTRALAKLEAFAAAANGKATKIIIPSEIQGAAALAAGLVESVKDAGVSAE